MRQWTHSSKRTAGPWPATFAPGAYGFSGKLPRLSRGITPWGILPNTIWGGTGVQVSTWALESAPGLKSSLSQWIYSLSEPQSCCLLNGGTLGITLRRLFGGLKNTNIYAKYWEECLEHGIHSVPVSCYYSIIFNNSKVLHQNNAYVSPMSIISQN